MEYPRPRPATGRSPVDADHAGESADAGDDGHSSGWLHTHLSQV